MSKRRRGNRHQVFSQVPTLASLAQHAHNLNTGRRTLRPFRAGRVNMDTTMQESGPSAKRQRGGEEQVGQGLQVTVPRAVPHLYNNSYTVKLTYADNYRHDISQNGTAGSYQHFNMNSIFDPDSTGTGHQPLMRDLWASQYDYYAVIQCDYKIRLWNAAAEAVTYTAAGTNAQLIGCVNVVQTLGTTNVSDISGPAAAGPIYPAAEMKNTVTHFLPPGELLELNGSLTQGDFLVDAKDADTDSTWTANGSNPAVLRKFGYSISPAQWAAIVGVSELPVSAIIAQAVLEYTVQFTQMNQSLRSSAS